MVGDRTPTRTSNPTARNVVTHSTIILTVVFLLFVTVLYVQSFFATDYLSYQRENWTVGRVEVIGGYLIARRGRFQMTYRQIVDVIPPDTLWNVRYGGTGLYADVGPAIGPDVRAGWIRILLFGDGFVRNDNPDGSYFHDYSITIPDWFPLLLGIALLRWLLRRQKRSNTKQTGVCNICGYDLCATLNRCPECGKVQTG